jgi:hypothetical protein
VITGETTRAGRHSIPFLVWYGEGWWGDPHASYRNLGAAFSTVGRTDLTGYSSDIPAERPDYSTYPGTLVLRASSGTWRASSVIDIYGGWDERWTLVQAANYVPLRPPKACGRYFQQYSVTYVGHTGSGVRCVMRIGMSIKVWFGAGTLAGKSYSQLGFLSSKGYGARDLCGPSFGTRCQAWAPGSVTLREAKQIAHKKGQPQTITATYKTASGTRVETWRRKP